VSFWLKTEGSRVRVALRSEQPRSASQPVDALDGAALEAGAWQRVEHQYTVPEPYDNLRFELSVLTPGTVWIDDVRIEGL
jgi:hypothetical protein